MSGGHFDYIQFRITDPIQELEDLAREEWPEDVRKDMLLCVQLLREASIRLHRIDYLVCDDDGVDTYRKRLAEDLSDLNK